MQLNERLQAIADMITQDARIADIGTDHAYLPIYLVEQGKVTWAVAGEVNRGPYNAAKAAIERAGREDKIDLRLGDGLAVVRPGEVDTVVIAGMGGNTIIDILKDRPEVVESVSQLILQPMVAAASVRRWLKENGWYISDESLVLEEGRLYEIISAIKGAMPEFEPILFDIGPVLWKQKSPFLNLHIRQLISQTKRVVSGMEASDAVRNNSRYLEYRRRLSQLEDKQKCLLNVRS